MPGFHQEMEIFSLPGHFHLDPPLFGSTADDQTNFQTIFSSQIHHR